MELSYRPNRTHKPNKANDKPHKTHFSIEKFAYIAQIL